MIYDLKLGGSQFAQNGCKCIDFVIGSFIETTGCDWVLSPQPTCILLAQTTTAEFSTVLVTRTDYMCVGFLLVLLCYHSSAGL